ncbi:hypothetical protein ABPG72_014097 [Tetrahymena utriculariae]
MSVVYKYDQSFFTCSICLSDEFSNGEQLPLQLNCDHIFHISCYENLVKFKKSKQVSCPNCRKISQQKRISYEIFGQSEQIFLENQFNGEKFVVWINLSSTFEDIIQQITITKGDSFTQLINQNQSFIITPLGKIISLNLDKSNLVKDYGIVRQQKLILRIHLPDLNSQNSE